MNVDLRHHFLKVPIICFSENGVLKLWQVGKLLFKNFFVHEKIKAFHKNEGVS